jgi:hypothetical protein
MLGDYLVDYKVISRHRLSLAFMGLYELYARAIFFLLFPLSTAPFQVFAKASG